MRKTVLKYGLLAGLVMAIMLVVNLRFHEQIGFENGVLVGYTSMVLAFLMVYFGILNYREQVSGGQISFGRAFSVGLLITLVASACYVAVWECIYYMDLVPGFIEKYVAYALEQLSQSGASPEQIAAQAKEMAEFIELYKNPLFNIAISLLEPLPVGLIFTLVSAGILSRKRASRIPAAVTA